MATYLTVEEISRTEWNGGTMVSPSPCNTTASYPSSNVGPFPNGESKTYQPLSETSFKYDPTKVHNRNWSKIKESGEISFTPYSVSKTTIENMVVERRFDFAKWKFHVHGCDSSQKATVVGPWEGHLIYNRRSTIVDHINECIFPLIPLLVSYHDEQVMEAISTTQQAAFASATSTYDLLTELVEMGETLKFMQSLVGSAAASLSSFAKTAGPTFLGARGMSAKQMLSSKNKALQKLGSRWMAYRYALMPILYSLKDINELLGKSALKYQSGRNKESIKSNLTLDDYTIPSTRYLVYQTCEITTDVRSLFKVAYDKGALQRLFSQVSFNPFVTAWELIPLSFVVDWFINVGDAIVSATRIDSSTQSLGVTGIKTIRKDRTMLYDFSSDSSQFVWNGWLDSAPFTKTYKYQRFINAPLQEVRTESYNRVVFSKPEPKLEFSVYLNWKRILDGLVLSYSPIRKLLRSL